MLNKVILFIPRSVSLCLNEYSQLFSSYTLLGLVDIWSLFAVHRDKMFPALGFGAQLPPDWKVRKCLSVCLVFFFTHVRFNVCVLVLAPA